MNKLKSRGIVINVFIGLVFLTFIIRLFSLQVLTNQYEGQAEQRSVKKKIITPARGAIYDRNRELYVTNSPIFDLMIDYKELFVPDTNLLVEELGISSAELVKAIKNARATYKKSNDYILTRNIEPEQYSTLQEKLWNFRGISFGTYNKRNYLYPVGANFLGYISEVDSNDMKRFKDSIPYAPGDIIGKTGLEKFYEPQLLGKKGLQVVLKNPQGREVGAFQEGKQDITAVKGQDVMLGIDVKLQELGEKMMQNKKGSVVAIDPSTGEILAFVSAPAYDPALLTGKDQAKNWKALRRDSLNPLYNRPLMATYPPGSIFKLVQALIGLNESTLTPDTYYGCGGGFRRNKGKPGCHGHPSPLSLHGAIQHSCNAYFAAVYVDFLSSPKYKNIYEAYAKWYDYMSKMGVGRKLGIDLPSEKKGLLPSAEMYDNPKRWYGPNKWGPMTIISNSIGQGEILMTPLQMANMAAIFANRGYYVQPHILSAFRKPNLPASDSTAWIKLKWPIIQSGIRRENYDYVVDAMEDVVKKGTGKRAFIKDIPICGKTGTVQNPHGGDHSVFVAFAPKDKPKIAIAAIIENAGGAGGTWAAPLVSVMIEQYIRGEVKEKKVEMERLEKARFLR